MSKMKQHLEERIVISHLEEENTGWKRLISFEYQGNHYALTLFWEEFNGYEIFWREPSKAPDWVINWNEDEHNGESFAEHIDWLTWESDK